MRAPAPLVLAFALLLLPPLAAAQESGSARAVVLLHHPHPDPRAGQADADPFGTPRAPLPPGLADAGGALRLPATRLDGVLRVSDAPEGNPASALAHFREAQRHLLLRERAGAPAAIEIAGRIEARTLRLDLILAPLAPLENASLELRVVVFEDGVPDPFAPRVHRFVARHVEPPEPVDLARPAQAAREIPLDPAWDPRRLGVAVSLAHAGAPGGRYEPGEILQSAAWHAGQEGPTVQVAKAVLVEAATATWCDACRPVEESLALLSSQFGAASAQAAPASYDVRPGPLALGGLLAGCAAGVALLRRRAA